MKVNLIFEAEAKLAGYLNISPYTNENSSEMKKGILDNLDILIDSGEVDELRAIDILDYFPSDASEQILSNWLVKPKHGGKIIIGTVDLLEVAKGIANYDLSIDQGNLFLHGEQKKPWDFRKANFHINQIAEYIMSKNYKVLKKRVANYRCIVEAQRL